MLIVHRLFLPHISNIRNQCRFISNVTKFISSKTPGTPRDETNPVDESLRTNVRLLGDSLGRTIARDLGEDFLEEIESIRKYAKRQDNGAQLHEYLRNLPDNHLLPVARSFNQFLQLANIAEQHHRVYSKRVDDESRIISDRKNLVDLFKRVLNEKQDANQLLLNTFSNMRIELVLTAHPTETIRRTLIQKYDSIEKCLELLKMLNADGEDKYISETTQRTRERLEELISQAWYTDEFRHEKPSPIDGKLDFHGNKKCYFILFIEAKSGFAVVENSLWEAVPIFFRDLDQLLVDTTGERLPLHAAPIRFASWMGGDRDVSVTSL